MKSGTWDHSACPPRCMAAAVSCHSGDALEQAQSGPGVVRNIITERGLGHVLPSVEGAVVAPEDATDEAV
jgi:hypothetical protein